MPRVPGLRRARQQQALSQLDLAVKAGINRSTVVSAERGQTHPRPSTIRRLAEALGVEVRTLLR